MKTKVFFLFFLISVMSVTNSTAQIIIGNGSSANGYSSWPAVYGNYEYGARYQIIINAQELINEGAVAGNITAIAFDVSNVNNCSSLNNFTVKIGNSPQADFESSTSWITGLTTVNSTNRQPVSGWNTHTFDTPFYWNGSSDIVIETCFYNGSYSENASTKYTTLQTRKVIGSEGSFDPCTNTTTPYTYYERPNIKLTMGTNGINDIITKDEVRLYPNPINNFIFISSNEDEIKTITIFDLEGSIIYQLNDINKKELSINISELHLKKNIYFLKIGMNSKVINKKIIIY